MTDEPPLDIVNGLGKVVCILECPDSLTKSLAEKPTTAPIKIGSATFNYTFEAASEPTLEEFRAWVRADVLHRIRQSPNDLSPVEVESAQSAIKGKECAWIAVTKLLDLDLIHLDREFRLRLGPTGSG